MITKAAVKVNVFTTLCDWIRCGEMIIPCHRHADAYEILHMFRLRRYMEYDVIAEGFLDDKDNFLSRVDAWSEAFRCAQFPEKVMEQYWTGEKDLMVPTALYSEDLW